MYHHQEQQKTAHEEQRWVLFDIKQDKLKKNYLYIFGHKIYTIGNVYNIKEKCQQNVMRKRAYRDCGSHVWFY